LFILQDPDDIDTSLRDLNLFSSLLETAGRFCVFTKIHPKFFMPAY